jgi:NAD(P)-dependent dehydrogenase (short-subunit alcohol dehydrogenase family)
VQEALARSLPLGRLGEPAEIADAVAYLVGASFATGAHLLLDGGCVL